MRRAVLATALLALTACGDSSSGGDDDGGVPADAMADASVSDAPDIDAAPDGATPDARVDAATTPDAMDIANAMTSQWVWNQVSGRIGGAIRDEDVYDTLLPGLAETLAATVAADCSGSSPPCCDAGSTGETLIDLFDDDDDCAITVMELEQNSLISSLLAPDLDLFDASGNFAPNVDGVRDALSIGLGFTAVPATFAAP